MWEVADIGEAVTDESGDEIGEIATDGSGDVKTSEDESPSGVGPGRKEGSITEGCLTKLKRMFCRTCLSIQTSKAHEQLF